MEYSKVHFKKIDFVFFNAGKIRDAIVEARCGRVEHNVNGSGIGDPTAAQAMHRIMPIKAVVIDCKRLEWPESWMRVVDAVYNLCDERHLYVLAAKYGGENYKRVCQQLHIAQSTHSKMWSEIRRFQELCAVQEGLIRIF